MWELEIFTKDQMVAWENKPAAQQMWQALQDYFTEKWLERCQYSQVTAKHSCFKDAALAVQEIVMVEGEGEMTAMMFVLLQEQHRLQIETLAAANQQTMDVMLEQMNAIIAGQGKHWTRKTSILPTLMQQLAQAESCTRKQNAHIEKNVFHTAAYCCKLEANASK